jgi:hypothetical protein
LIKLIDGTRFYHIPRTGGTWIQSVLRQLDVIEHGHKRWKKHITPVEYKPNAFCVARDPDDWIGSWYRYQCRRGWLEWGLYHKHPCFPLNNPPETAMESEHYFREWIAEVHPGFAEDMMAGYTSMVGTVLDFTRLQEDVFKLLIDRGYNAKRCRSIISTTPAKNTTRG